MNDEDINNLTITLDQARESLANNDYPVGAVLKIGNNIYYGNNKGETTKNYSNHAETTLLISHGDELLQASKDNVETVLYSSLEPCLMCLGVAVMNKISKIIYIQKDPLAGACSIDRMSMGERYKNVWPEIIYNHISGESKEMIVAFLEKQIANEIRVDWSKKFLEMLKSTE